MTFFSNFQGIQLVSNCDPSSVDEPPKYLKIYPTLQIELPQDSTYIYSRCLTLFCLTWILTTHCSFSKLSENVKEM